MAGLHREVVPAGIIDIRLHEQDQTITNIRTALEVGQLVKDEYFTLFESIGAIEVPSLPSHPTTTLLMNYNRSWTPKWTAASYNLEKL
jgi:hypothetical protein